MVPTAELLICVSGQGWLLLKLSLPLRNLYVYLSMLLILLIPAFRAGPERLLDFHLF